MAEFTVVTFNLHGMRERWWRREPLIVRELAELRPDVICLQEAATWSLQARRLAWRLSRVTGTRYHTSQARKRGWRGLFEGLAILSRRPLSEDEWLALGREGRIAQRVVVEVDGEHLVIANTHLEHRRNTEMIRRSQAMSLARWLESQDEPIVLAGDFNDTPESGALQALTVGFRSAHRALEPALAGTYSASSPSRVIDYILVVERVEVVEAGTCFAEPVDGVWLSDHVGLWARMRL